jgi:hypothetical protein
MTTKAALSVPLCPAWSSLRIIALCGILALPVNGQSREPQCVNRMLSAIVREEPRHE